MLTNWAVARRGTNASIRRCTSIGPEVLEGSMCVGGENQARESGKGRCKLHIVSDVCERKNQVVKRNNRRSTILSDWLAQCITLYIPLQFYYPIIDTLYCALRRR